MDNAKCNTANLTRLLLDKVGCSPIFITPNHSQANGLAERTIGSLKDMIHKVAYDHQKSWHLYLDFILWAMREAPQASTGVPPWTMAFGRLPRGPLAILQETWTGENQLPPDLNKPVADYLSDLRDKLTVANDFAASHTAHAQRLWADRYNSRARDKRFEVGEQVMVSSPDYIQQTVE